MPAAAPSPSAPPDLPRDRLMTVREVTAETSLSIATIYRRMAAGEFPRALHLGGNRVGWRASAVDQWMRDRELTG